MMILKTNGKTYTTLLIIMRSNDYSLSVNLRSFIGFQKTEPSQPPLPVWVQPPVWVTTSVWVRNSISPYKISGGV